MGDKTSRKEGGFLSGAGDARLKKRLLLDRSAAQTTTTASTDLVARLRAFLPVLEKANANLPLGSDGASGIEIIPVEDNPGDDQSVEENDDEFSGSHSESSENEAGLKVEMNISLFPVEDDDEEDEDNDANAPVTSHRPSHNVMKKKPVIEEMDS